MTILKCIYFCIYFSSANLIITVLYTKKRLEKYYVVESFVDWYSQALVLRLHLNTVTVAKKIRDLCENASAIKHYGLGCLH